jgi:hypothetical protein
MSLAKVPHCRPIEGDPTKKTLLMDKSLIQDEAFLGFAKEKNLQFENSHIEVEYENFNY